MGKSPGYFSHLLSIILLFVFTLPNGILAVPAILNESIIVGRVVEYAVSSSSVLNIKPDQTIYSITVDIESSEGVDMGPDFLTGKKGEAVRFFSKEKLSRELFGSHIKARVSYKGDESGGKFWINGIEVMN